MGRPARIEDVAEGYLEGLNSDLSPKTIPGWNPWKKVGDKYVPTTVNAYKRYDFPQDQFAPPDYTPNWKVPEGKQAAFNYSQGWSGGGLLRGNILEADKLAKNSNPIKNVVFSPGVWTKASLNNFVEGYDRSLNSLVDWKGNHLDRGMYKNLRKGGLDKGIAEGLTKTAKIGRKGLLMTTPLMDALDFGSRVAEGKNVARAGAEAVGSIAGWELGLVPGQIVGGSIGSVVGGGIGALLAPVTGGTSIAVGSAIGRVIGSFGGGYLGGMTGSRIGEGLTTKGYEAITEDDWEKGKPMRNAQENAMKQQEDTYRKQWSENLARQMANRRQEAIRQIQSSQSWLQPDMRLEY